MISKLSQRYLRHYGFDNWTFFLKCRVGQLLYWLGKKPTASHGIGGDMNLGYGRLSDSGYWDIPAPGKAYKSDYEYCGVLYNPLMKRIQWRDEDLERNLFVILEEFNNRFRLIGLRITGKKYVVDETGLWAIGIDTGEAEHLRESCTPFGGEPQ